MENSYPTSMDADLESLASIDLPWFLNRKLFKIIGSYQENYEESRISNDNIVDI